MPINIADIDGNARQLRTALPPEQYAFAQQVVQACQQAAHSADTTGATDLSGEALAKLLVRVMANGDLQAAGSLLYVARRQGVAIPGAAALIRASVIDMDEARYRATFHANLELLQNGHLPVSPPEPLTFEHAVGQLAALPYAAPAETPELIPEQGDSAMLVDPSGTALIELALSRMRLFVYVVYDDWQQFLSLLLFADLTALKDAMRPRVRPTFAFSRVAHKLFLFAGCAWADLQAFLADPRVAFPRVLVDLSQRRGYGPAVQGSWEARQRAARRHRQEANHYYSGLDAGHFKRLFSGAERPLRVLLFSSRNQYINPFISANWHKAFLALGFDSRLLLEEQPYHNPTGEYFFEQLNTFRPDAVLWVNQAVGDLIPEAGIRKSLLWLGRFRDVSSVVAGVPINYEHNMFVVAVTPEWASRAMSAGLPQERYIYEPDGVDVETFSVREYPDAHRYEADIVNVNSAAGQEGAQRQALLAIAGDDQPLRTLVHRLCDEIAADAAHDRFVFFPQAWRKRVDAELASMGRDATLSTRAFLSEGCVSLAAMHYRVRLMTWIIESGITNRIKLWGDGWTNIERFRPYAMGIAHHDNDLPAIYQHSKISLHDQGYFSMHERIFEILSCGGFPLVKRPTPDYPGAEGLADFITNYFVEDEEIVLFGGKDDLLQKIAFYLENREAREEISLAGRRRARRDFSSLAVATRTMRRIAAYFIG